MEGFLNLIRLFWAGGFPLHKPYIYTAYVPEIFGELIFPLGLDMLVSGEVDLMTAGLHPLDPPFLETQTGQALT